MKNHKIDETVDGRKVRLRPFAAEDAAALAEAAESSASQLKRRFAWAAEAPYDAGAFVRRAQERAPTGVFVVVEPKGDRFAGVASVAEEDPGSGRMRLSGWIRSDRAGRGLATEAGLLLVDHAFKRLGAHRVYARIDPANRAGRRVIRKLGFRYEGCLREDKRLNGRWVDQECWGILKKEWKSRP